ncbi:MAG: plasmid maintenance protein CcdB [Polaromonas sp.]|nr:plasmid maintenance protein CcdB [Polaromonas sp.]
MARYDVYPNPDSEDSAATPYLLDVQNNFLEIATRVVVPLHDASRFGPASVRDLNPEFEVLEKMLIMNTAAIGAIPAADLRRPLANLASQSAAIQNALDTLFGGF